jgi:DNA-binding SARP family transcriptional activator
MGRFVEFRLLGPVGAWVDGSPLPVAAAKQQALLAAGLLTAGRTISVDRLVSAVWGDDAPATAPDLVKSYVSALRRVVHRPGTAPVILTRPPGYLFQVGPDALDLHHFEALVSEGRRAAAAGQPADASRALQSALQLWHGPALGGLGGALLQAEAARLEELRQAVVEDRIAADLALGRAAGVLPELVGLVAAEPLRERLRGQLMVALARLGRQADALAVYQQGRALLRDDFGLDPGPELQRLHHAILTGQETVEPPRVTGGGWMRPAQLPPDPGELSGRDADARTVGAALRTAAAGAGSAMTLAISGMAGVGKSALAIHAAHAACADFPDGQLYATLDADGREVDVGEVLARFLRALGHQDPEVPASTVERSALFRSALASRRVLIVLDGVRSEWQVRPLLPGTPGCAVLITARPRLTGLESADHLPLDVLTLDDSVRLLARIVGAGRVAADPAAAREIAVLCGYLPLALRAAGARLAARSLWPLSTLAARLRDEAHRLDELTAGDLGVRGRFDASYRALNEPERRAFALLGAVGMPSLTPSMAARVLAVSTAEAERRLDRLAEAQLVDLAEVGADGQLRYRFHELARIFARERGEADETLASRREAAHRVLSAA